MPTSVLIIDDSRSSREEVTAALLEAAVFDSYLTAKNGLEGFRVLLDSKADLVICDLQMPHLDGLGFLQLAQAQPELQDIPVIMLTGNQERDVKLQGLEHGASDFLTKPFDPAELVARVKIHLKIKRLQEEQRLAKEHFRQLSNTDPLTALYNRRFLDEMLEAEAQRARRLGSTLCLLIADIDHFKRINDAYGHHIGDRVLVAVAETLRRELRSYDIASRYGGEEFAVVLPGTSLEAGTEVAERLRLAVQSLRFEPPLQEVRVTVSIGVGAILPDHARLDEPDAAFTRADTALYRAKKQGRNRVEAG